MCIRDRPLFGVLYGYLLLGESLSIYELSGGVLVLVGVMLATNVLAKFKRSKQQTII